ncbi:MAG: FHA domain-containing protein [Candidatus Omnitrophica bacterium]|nr:FHA domain-containing protein [Candidatus Omnitrophota bacterium]
MEKIVFEISYSNRSKPFYYHLDKDEIRIGRAFDNDLLISDPCVSGRHLIVRREPEGVLSVEDAGSENGSLLNGTVKISGKQVFSSGDYFVIGRTKIKVFLESHAVAPTVLLGAPNKFLTWMDNPYSAVILFILVNGLFMLQQYFSVPVKVQWVQLLASNIVPVAIMLAWAGFWTFIGWLVRRKVSFFAQLSVTFFAFILSVPVFMVVSYWVFLAGTWGGMLTAMTVCIGGWLVFLLTESLALATYWSRKQRVGYSVIFILLIAISAGVLVKAKFEDFSGRPNFVRNLMPPYFKFYKTRKISQFIKDSSFVFENKREKK